jgi:heterogeneous nuclear ribonucleoprotein F/H
LGNPMQMDFALQKNRQSMGRRYIEVFRSKKQDYYHGGGLYKLELS